MTDSTSLAIVTPCRGRYAALHQQALALAEQLVHDDMWLVGRDEGMRDNNREQVFPEEWRDDIELELIGSVRNLAIVDFQYYWLRFSARGIVDRLANALAATSPPTHHIVEIDDHDPVAPDALSEIRHAFEAGYDYVFGWHEQRIKIDPDGEWERWPTVERDYTPGAFARHEFDAIGLRAIRRSLWDKLGGRDSSKFPFGHYDLAVRAEALGARIVCLQKPLCTVTIEPVNSICGMLHAAPLGVSSSSGNST